MRKHHAEEMRQIERQDGYQCEPPDQWLVRSDAVRRCMLDTADTYITLPHIAGGKHVTYDGV